MTDSLAPLLDFNGAALALMFVRLVLAMLLGLAIAWVYRRARGANGEAESFGVTLVLLTILIAMVTQVIGDNVARVQNAFGGLNEAHALQSPYACCPSFRAYNAIRFSPPRFPTTSMARCACCRA